MKYLSYDFTKYFNYIRQELGNNIYYDEISHDLNGILYLRCCKVNNFAQIMKLKNGKFSLIYCFNDIGVIYSRIFNSVEKCIKFLKDFCFSGMISSLHNNFSNKRLPKIYEVKQCN